MLQAEGSALPLQGDVAELVDNVPVLRLALSLGEAGANRRFVDAVVEGQLGGDGGGGRSRLYQEEEEERVHGGETSN